MDTQDTSALRAPPSGRFLLNELPNTISLDGNEVIDDAEVVLRSIAEVHVAYSCAGERVALKAETP